MIPFILFIAQLVASIYLATLQSPPMFFVCFGFFGAGGWFAVACFERGRENE